MSALSGTRSAAASSAAIAPFQSSAPSAFLPALKSGSSCGQSASDAPDAMVVQIGQASAVVAVSARRSSPPDGGVVGVRQPGELMVYAATPLISTPSIIANATDRIIVISRPDGFRARVRATRQLFSCSTCRIVLARVGPGLTDFLPLRVSVFGQIHQLAKVLGGFLVVTCAVSGAGGSPEHSEAVGGLLERDLELVQGSSGLPRLKEQFRQQFAERIETILHRHMLEAAVFAVSCCSHELQGLIARTFLQCDPGRNGKHLLLGTVGPVGLVGALQCCSQHLHRFDLFFGPGKIASARHANESAMGY